MVGDSETGEMDKVDGPYYFFKLIRRIRGAVPQWMPMLGVEGREINLVPVDFVVRAMDHIAHKEGLDGTGLPPHRSQPAQRRRGDRHLRSRRQRAGVVGRLPPGAVDLAEPLLRLGLRIAPLADTLADRVLADFGIPRSVLTYVNYPTHFDSRQAQAALADSDIRVPPLNAYADKLWDYWERQLDPDLFSDRTLVGAVRGRRGVVSGPTQILEQQVPDELLRLGRRVRGAVSLEKSVRGRVVMVTGASSGIGRSAALKIADAGGIVLLVARTPEKLEATREQIAAGGGEAHVYPCDLSDMDDLDRMADEVLAEHGHVDVLVNNAGRSIRRSIALSYDRFHDFERTMQLNYFGAVKLILKLLPVMRERKTRADRQRQLDRRADEHAALLGLRRLEGGPGRLLALCRLGDRRRRGPHHDDPHAAGADADDQSDEDVRPLPDPHARARRRPDLRGDHPPAEADRDAAGDAGPAALRDQPDARWTTSSTAPTSCSRIPAQPRGARPATAKAPAAEQASNEQVAFAYLMRGIHW